MTLNSKVISAVHDLCESSSVDMQYLVDYQRIYWILSFVMLGPYRNNNEGLLKVTGGRVHYNYLQTAILRLLN